MYSSLVNRKQRRAIARRDLARRTANIYIRQVTLGTSSIKLPLFPLQDASDNTLRRILSTLSGVYYPSVSLSS